MGLRSSCMVRAFSLIELMIAIVVLGLGLIMVATMFPAAWGRARQLGELTVQGTITENAHTTISLLARVDGLNTDAGSFAGDLIYEKATNSIITFSDTRVHAMYLENLSAAAPRTFRPDRDDPAATLGAPWVLEILDWEPGISMADLPSFLYDDGFAGAQVQFGDRVYPPMRPRDDVDTSGAFLDDDSQWDDSLARRRFAWAVLHRMRTRVGPEFSAPNALGAAAAASPGARQIDLYYVTLRRRNPNYRFVQQDSVFAPDPLAPGTPVSPAALGTDEDVILPVPWRVQILLPDTLSFVGPTHIPTEVAVGADPVLGTNALAAALFRQGSWFVDELTGTMHRVEKYRLNAAGDLAHMTLDYEILADEVDDGQNVGFLEPDDLLRTVWVFPPPVEAIRAPDGTPIFTGAQPVVGIDMRTMTLSPG